MLFVQSAIPHSYTATNIQYPNHKHDMPIHLETPESFVKWSWSRKSRTMRTTTHKHINDELKKKSELAHGKYLLVLTIMSSLSRGRVTSASGFAHQDAVYATKRREAQLFKDAGYDESVLADIPFVTQYADYASLSFREAADEILVKAKLDDERLAKTELMRLVYSSKIKNAKSMQEIAKVREEFRFDMEVSGRLS